MQIRDVFQSLDTGMFFVRTGEHYYVHSPVSDIPDEADDIVYFPPKSVSPALTSYSLIPNMIKDIDQKGSAIGLTERNLFIVDLIRYSQKRAEAPDSPSAGQAADGFEFINENTGNLSYCGLTVDFVNAHQEEVVRFTNAETAREFAEVHGHTPWAEVLKGPPGNASMAAVDDDMAAADDDMVRGLEVEVTTPPPRQHTAPHQHTASHQRYPFGLLKPGGIPKQIPESDITVLIQGETGTGKEEVARQIHEDSKQSQGPFVAINCGAISKELIESELFGHVKGAFTGATDGKAGLLEEATNGTLFLDEIGEMPLDLQVKLLRVLSNGEYRPVGSTDTKTMTNVRVVAATNRDLAECVSEGTFREDLFYRLNGDDFLHQPPLRSQPDDIPNIATYFVEKFAADKGKDPVAIMPRAREALQAYDWPGNFRQLQSKIERAFALCDGNNITLEHLSLPSLQQNPRSGASASVEEQVLEGLSHLSFPEIREWFDEAEKRAIRRALKQGSGVRNRAAILLEVNRTTLLERAKKLGMNLLAEARVIEAEIANGAEVPVSPAAPIELPVAPDPVMPEAEPPSSPAPIETGSAVSENTVALAQHFDPPSARSDAETEDTGTPSYIYEPERSVDSVAAAPANLSEEFTPDLTQSAEEVFEPKTEKQLQVWRQNRRKDFRKAFAAMVKQIDAETDSTTLARDKAKLVDMIKAHDSFLCPPGEPLLLCDREEVQFVLPKEITDRIREQALRIGEVFRTGGEQAVFQEPAFQGLTKEQVKGIRNQRGRRYHKPIAKISEITSHIVSEEFTNTHSDLCTQRESLVSDFENYVLGHDRVAIWLNRYTFLSDHKDARRILGDEVCLDMKTKGLAGLSVEKFGQLVRSYTAIKGQSLPAPGPGPGSS